MAPRFSVLLPTHNRADVLPFAIKSVLAQTERDFELLIVGDGCTDDTAQVVASFDDPRICWFDLPKGPTFGYANRNIALRQTQGELVAFMAHDDLLFRDHLTQLGQRIDATGADLIYSRPLWVSPGGVVIPLSGNLHNADELDAFFEHSNFIPASCVVYSRTALERAGYWPEDIEVAADWHLWRRIIEDGARRNFVYHPTPTTLHFKANWRKGFRTDIAMLAEIANTSAWWPAALKVSVGGHTSEQAAISALLDDPASRWAEEARRTVTLVIERLAWEHTTTCLNLRHGLPEELAGLRHLLTYKDVQLASLSAHLPAGVSAMTSGGLTPPPQFVEEDYLSANPDVAESVARGEFRSGFDHWAGHGWRERRALRPQTLPTKP